MRSDPLNDDWALYDLAVEKWPAGVAGPCRTCLILYRAGRVRCPVCGYWKAA